MPQCKLPWCVEPFVSMTIHPPGYYNICVIANSDPLTSHDIKPIEWWNLDRNKMLRDDMIDHVISPAIEKYCQKCLVNEKLGITSRRQVILQHLNRYDGIGEEKIIQNIEKHKSGEDYTHNDVLTANLKPLGNLCNLKCYMCSPWSSSKIAAEEKEHRGFNKPVLMQGYNGEDKKKELFHEIYLMSNNMTKMHIQGGEPLIHPDFPEFIELISQSPNAKNLHVEINTNATVIPNILYNIAEKFRKLTLIVSVDGVGERGSYVRSGLNWKKFDDNVKQCVKHDKIEVQFLPTISLLTIGYLDDITDYISQYVENIVGNIHWANFVVAPEYFRPSLLPVEIKQFYIEKMKYHIENKWQHYVFDSIKSCLNGEQESHELFIQGIKKIKSFDKVRNANLLDHFPEFKDYYESV